MPKKHFNKNKYLDADIDQIFLEKFQEIYGVEGGREKFSEIQDKVKRKLLQTDEKSWHEREEQKEQRRLKKWMLQLQGLNISDLVDLREKVREDVKRKKKRSLYSEDEEEAYIDAQAFYETIEKAISEGPTKNIWTQKKGDFAKFVVDEYNRDPKKFSFDKKRATREIFSEYEFPEYPDWTWEQCYDLVKKYHA